MHVQSPNCATQLTVLHSNTLPYKWVVVKDGTDRTESGTIRTESGSIRTESGSIRTESGLVRTEFTTQL